MTPPQRLGETLSSALEKPIAELMERSVVFARPEMDLRSALQLMIARDVMGLPVVDGRDRPVGVLSQSDLIRDWFAHSSQRAAPPDLLEGPAIVEDLMTPLVFSLPETATIAQAAALMVYERIHRVPVISARNRVVGIVSPLDILRRLATLAGFKNPGLPLP